MASEDFIKAINATCVNKGGKYAEYSCKVVAWDDATRGVVDGNLSKYGPSITDTWLRTKNGDKLCILRPSNFNEKIGKIGADSLATIVGNLGPGPDRSQLKTVSLKTLLSNIHEYGQRAGCASMRGMFKKALDEESVSIRFQTAFLPIGDDEASIEFVTEAHNANTRTDRGPKNLMIVCSTQGVAVWLCGKGPGKLFHQRVDQVDKLQQVWLEAEKTQYKVGGQQLETAEEREDAMARGKGTSELIGTEAMGMRCNVVMTVQVPLKRQRYHNHIIPHKTPATQNPKHSDYDIWAGTELERPWRMVQRPQQRMRKYSDYDIWEGTELERPSWRQARRPQMRMRAVESYGRAGKSSAARVSLGSDAGAPKRVSAKPERSQTEHVTVTVMIYNVVAGGVPSEDDVIRAIDDLEQLYESCEWTGRLADDGVSFMRKEMTEEEVRQVAVGV